MATLAELIVKVGADATQFEKHMNKIERTLNKTSRTLSDVGGKLTTGLTLPLAAVGGASLKASVDFESAFAGVRKTVDATDEELAALSEGIRRMAKETPQSATAIAGIAEAAGQLGIQTENILSFTETMADLGVATNMTSDEAATALARLANITQMPQTEFDRLGSTIVALGNNLATTEAEIVEMGLRIAGAGSQVGMTEAAILGFAGALSSVGIAAEAGGSAISKVMINIASEVASGGAKLEGFAAVAGMTSKDFARAWRDDAAGALVTFIEGLGRMSDAGENVFGVLDELGLSEIRVRDALLRASGAGDLFRQSIQLGSQAWQENTALTTEAAQRYGTTESQLQILRNQLTDVAITLGDALAPAFSAALTAAQPLIDAIARLADRFANLDPEAQRLIINIGLMAAAIGPLLLAMGKVVSTASGMVNIFKMVGTNMMGLVGTGGKLMEAFALWRGGAGTFVEAMGLVISPIGAVMAAITALAGVIIYLWNTNDQFREAILATWEHIKEAAMQIWGSLQEWWAIWGETIMAYFTGLWEQIKLIFQTAMDIIANVLMFVMALIRGDWEAAWNAIKGIAEATWNFLLGTVQNFATLFLNVFEGIKNGILATWEKVKEGIANIWKGIVNSIIGFVNKIIDAINGMIGQLNKVSFSVPSWVPGLGGKRFGFNIPTLARIPMLAQGGIVMRPTLAMIGEAGPEAVVPLDRAGAIGTGPVIIIVELDGRRIAQATAPHLTDLIRLKTGVAY